MEIRESLAHLKWDDKMKKKNGNRMLEHSKRGAR